MKKKNIALPVLFGLTVAVILTIWLNSRILIGAQKGASNIDLDETYQARTDPDAHNRKSLPYAAGAGLVGGLITFGLIYLMIPAKKID